MRGILDTLSDPTEVEQALEKTLDIMSQIPITVIASGKTCQQILEGDLRTKILEFVTFRQAIAPYPESEYMQKLKQMTVKDEGVHPQITDLKIEYDEFCFMVDNIGVVVHLVDRGQYKSLDDCDTVRYGFSSVWVPNTKAPAPIKEQLL